MVRIQDDLFSAVNEQWLETAQIPVDKPRISAFDELVLENEEKLTRDLKSLVEDLPQDNPFLAEAIKFYRKVGDWDQRNKENLSTLQREVEKIQGLASFEDFIEALPELVFHSEASLPFSLSVEPDMKDAVHYALGFSGPGLILPDTTYYEEGHPRKQELLDFWEKNTREILEKLEIGGAEKIASSALAFDALLVPSANTSEEWAKYADLYHPVAFETFAKQVSHLPVASFIETLVKTKPDQIIVFEDRFYDSFDRLIRTENWELIQAWMVAKLVRQATTYLSEEMRILGSAYGRFLSNISEARSQEKHQLDVTERYFSQVIGKFYGEKYFGQAAKVDVEKMVAAMVEVYQKRLQSNTWLSEATVEKAIEKLDAITPMIGYPDKLPPVQDKLIVSDGTSLYEDVIQFNRILTARHYEKFTEEVDKTEWHMPAHMVNAYYSPDSNTIVFPAAILQAPFYSLNQTASQNYGGIGGVIAHEISHAFDNNGAQFDKAGNLNKWWTDADYTAFELKQKEMIAAFDGVETEAGPTNGTLIVSENIADQGGITAALAAAKAEGDVDLEAFFRQWASIWRMKAKKEFQQMLLSMDVHAPAKLRANIPPTQLEEFYQVFGVEPGDQMYVAPDKRVEIW